MRKRKYLALVINFFLAISLLFAGCSGGSGSSSGSSNSGPVPALESGPTIEVAINQIETDCSNPGITEVTAYVSVINQDGDPVTGLTISNFSCYENTVEIPPDTCYENTVEIPPDTVTINFVDQIKSPLSVIMVMDYSMSMQWANAIGPMEDAVLEFVNYLSQDDEAEIIKFAGIIEIVQEFTSDKALLTSAITDPWDGGTGTPIYDVLFEAIDDAALAPDRKAVIIVTDGREHDSINGIDDVIAHSLSNQVPVFTIGLGNKIDVNMLTQIADETGGHFYEAATNDDLITIYQQISEILLLDQYVIKYESFLQGNVTLGVEVENNGLQDYASKEFTACP
jgi:VWFA-related protein